jgi:nucleoside-diphosphate-sugar epimerase
VTTVAITGATGIFGRALCARLESEPSVERVVGAARRPFDPAAYGFHKMEFHPGDVTIPSTLRRAFEGADVVCHLAFTVLDRGMSVETVRRINVDGSRNVFEAAVQAGARRIVHASSVAAYGAHPDNPVPITEDHPVRGTPGMFYSEHKAAVEHFLDDFRRRHRATTTVCIRPCVVVGPNSLDLFRGPVPAPLVGLALSPLVRFPFPDPGIAPMQFVHESDVAEVFTRAIVSEPADGAYNLAGGGTMTAGELAAALGAVRIPVPKGALRRLTDLAHRVGVVPTGSGWMELTAHPIIVDTTRARTELGWVPRYDTRTALQHMLGEFRRAVPLSFLR